MSLRALNMHGTCPLGDVGFRRPQQRCGGTISLASATRGTRVKCWER
jgi:hypothetical protein